MASSSPGPTPGGAPDGSLTDPARAGRRLDASMLLLKEVMEHPLDPGYAAAAAARAATGTAGGTGGGTKPVVRRPGPALVTIVIAALCGLLATWAVVELRRPEPGGIAARRALEQEIQRRVDHADATQRANAAVRARISAEQATALAQAGDAGLDAMIRRYAAVTGEVSVSGPGLLVTLDDAPTSDASPAAGDPRQATAADQGRVLDRDLQIVVNGLWAAGAEAVSVNDQRLSSLSAIRSAGEAILVDYRPLVPPYVIRAIGDRSALQAGFARDAAGPYLQALRDNYGVRTSIVPGDALVVLGAGVRPLRYATAVPSAAPPPSGTQSPSGTSLVAPSAHPTATVPGATQKGSG